MLITRPIYLIRTKVDILIRTLTGFRPKSNSPLLTEFVQSGVGTRAFYVGKVVWPRQDSTEIDQTPSLNPRIRRPILLSLGIRLFLAALRLRLSCTAQEAPPVAKLLSLDDPAAPPEYSVLVLLTEW